MHNTKTSHPMHVLTPMPTTCHVTRYGITLMEVLISIGILSVGLASVMALVPAGGNEARRALIADRRASLAANAMADAIARGILNPAKWSPIGTVPFRVAFDPLGGATFPPPIASTVLNGIAGLAAQDVFRSADDLAYDHPDDDDAPAVPIYSGGQRATLGSFSWLATLLPVAASDNYRLTVVTFHLRPVPPPIAGALNITAALGSNSIEVTGLSLSNEDFREIFVRGAPILLTDAAGTTFEWRTILLPMPITSASGVITEVELLLDMPTPPAVTMTAVYVYPGAVGVTEKIVTLEGTSPWSL